MKLTTLLMVLVILHVTAASLAQKVTLKEKNAPLIDVFNQISNQTGYDFAFTTDALKDTKPVTIAVTNKELTDVLKQLTEGQNLEYTLDNKIVVIKAKEQGLLSTIKSALTNAFANIDVRGRVVGDDGQPLSGATVQTKDGKQATSTDLQGFFTLSNAEPNATIVISFIGYEKTELPAKAQLGTITLKVAESKLDEVKVIAYGQTTERLSVANVSSISSKDIEKQNVNDPLLALKGRVSGLFVSQSSGVAGNAVQIKIQGQNSINAGNDPLYIIDGVPYPSQNINLAVAGTPQAGYGIFAASNTGGYAGNIGTGGSPFAYINPDDIESISVLKDADATAIYGSRAGNGAILITTKKGKAGETKVDIAIKQGWGNVYKFMPLLNTQQYIAMRYQGFKNDGLLPTATDYDVNGTYGNVNQYTDWQKALIGGTAKYADDNLSISGGTTYTQYLVSGTFHRETTVFPGNFSDVKGALHFNLNNVSQNGKFKMQFNGSYLADNNQLPQTDPTSIALTLNPNSPSFYNADGTFNWQLNSTGVSTWLNPLPPLLHQPYQNKTNNLVGNTILNYIILPGLTIKAAMGYTLSETNAFAGYELSALRPQFQNILGAGGRSSNYVTSQTSTWNIEPQLTYQHDFNKSKLDILLGATSLETSYQGLSQTGSTYSSDALLQDPKSATTMVVNSSSFGTYKYNAIFSRLNYVWDNKYIMDMTVRRDGSSRFGKNSQFHDFWAAGVAWLFTETKLIKDAMSWLSFGKLKISYGTTGNDQIGDYRYLNLYKAYSTGVAYQNSPTSYTTTLPNPDLHWELTKKLQGGISLGFLQDRILTEVNYVYNRSSNQLSSLLLPTITGSSNFPANVPAIVQNTEWEVSLNTINVKSTYFKWSSSFNITLPKNTLIATDPSLTTSQYAVGQPLNFRRTYHFLGVDPATGLYVFADSNGNPTSNPSSATDLNSIVNTAFPSFYGGFGNSVQFHQFGLDFFFQFAKQIKYNYLFGPAPSGLGGGVTGGLNQPIWVSGAWGKPGDIADQERYSATGVTNIQYSAATNSDAALSDASFVRLTNLSLSYVLPSNWLSKVHLRNVRLSAQCQNLITITKFKGLDPETGNAVLPPLKVFTFGLNVGL